jgi:hypothetical protein
MLPRGRGGWSGCERGPFAAFGSIWLLGGRDADAEVILWMRIYPLSLCRKAIDVVPLLFVWRTAVDTERNEGRRLSVQKKSR